MARFVDLAFNLPIDKRFTYLVPEDGGASIGSRATAPFGGRSLTGFIVAARDRPPPGVEARALSRIVDREPLVDRRMLTLARWIADTYLCSLGEALAAIVPGGRRESPLQDAVQPAVAHSHALTPAQRAALEGILQQTAGVSYLFGVTGSGKTAVFLEATRNALSEGRSVIYLVPEIGLTHQVVAAFTAAFGELVAVIHSGLTPSQRLSEWRRIQQGSARIAVGARSAVFAPVRDLGLIVIDEEHDGSYKASASPRYHARQVAAHRCRADGARLVMGSATPSVEAFFRMQSGAIRRYDLQQRVGGGAPPRIHLVQRTPNSGVLGPELTDALRRVHAEGRQSILFLNRRGFSHYFHCRSCDYVLSCERCSVTLTLHRPSGALVCHYCGYRTRPLQVCPECRSLDVRYAGFGTQRVEVELRRVLPDARIARADADSVRGRGAFSELLEGLRNGSIDVLVGTQMVAKGLDLPGVKLVGVVDADTALRLPDFRAAERTFALLVQVAGRAGRAAPDGEVLIQSAHPEAAPIAHAAAGRVAEFMAGELAARREQRFPPFVRLIRVVVRGRDEGKVGDAIDRLAASLAAEPEMAAAGVDLLGPAPCPIAKVARNHRHHLLLRAPTIRPILAAVRRRLLGVRLEPGLHLELDLDPVAVL